MFGGLRGRLKTGLVGVVGVLGTLPRRSLSRSRSRSLSLLDSSRSRSLLTSFARGSLAFVGCTYPPGPLSPRVGVGVCPLEPAACGVVRPPPFPLPDAELDGACALLEVVRMGSLECLRFLEIVSW